MIYFIQSGHSGPIKIGYTESRLSKRTHELQCGNPEELNVILTIDGSIEREKQLHQMFADARVRGEWFYPTKRLLAYINDALVPIREKQLESVEVSVKPNVSKVEQYLVAKGLNQAQFAAIARVNPVDISRLITGERPASVRVAKAVEAATGGEITRHDLRPDIYGDARIKEPS